MENYNVNEMNDQIATLKRNIEKQHNVIDTLMRESMQNKVNALSANARKSIICALLIAVFYPFFHYQCNISMLCIGVIIAINIVMAIAVYLVHKPLSTTNLMRGDTSSAISVVEGIRRFYLTYVKYWGFCYIPWAIWFAYELIVGMGVDERGSVVIGVLCGFIGAIVSVRNNKDCLDVVSRCEALLDQLTDGKFSAANASSADAEKCKKPLFDIRFESKRSIIGMFFSVVLFSSLWMAPDLEPIFTKPLCIFGAVSSYVILLVALFIHRQLNKVNDHSTLVDILSATSNYAKIYGYMHIVTCILTSILVIWMSVNIVSAYGISVVATVVTSALTIAGCAIIGNMTYDKVKQSVNQIAELQK